MSDRKENVDLPAFRDLKEKVVNIVVTKEANHGFRGLLACLERMVFLVFREKVVLQDLGAPRVYP